MLKKSGIIKLTLRENLRGQLLWSSIIVGIVLLIISAVLSGIALSHERRVIDVFSYFAADQLLVFVAILSGASICTTDFSSRGLAELFIPTGTTRASLYLARISAHATVLFILALSFFAIKASLLPLFTETSMHSDLGMQSTMFLFSWTKALTALAIAGFFGSLIRPLYSILATFTLFSFGHLTASFDSLLSSSQSLAATTELSQTNAFFYFIFKIWNPSLLIVQSSKGNWIQPSLLEIGTAISWAIGFILLSLCLTFLRINKLDIRA